ncbi:copper fist DNA binding domain-containing protein [Dactylonectria estremocensis]|uniref:Copper fist DNA binding domain-containing protein n=1 Tax=Dactylonectria estremocensis TaxID=1079267 RepID=A0A9P9DZ94_9HYPO|nr:copper fist DNA binding domain-containing protein [Dactylonectria estremocensis]
MIINGEKLACESCIRGHRVAQCQHADRPLQQIGSKGRPVSQCNHCRTLRKSRSLHTRCKCGSTARSSSRPSGRDRCHCFDGGPCVCAHKTVQPAVGTIGMVSSDDQGIIGLSPSTPSSQAAETNSVASWHTGQSQLTPTAESGNTKYADNDGVQESCCSSQPRKRSEALPDGSSTNHVLAEDQPLGGLDYKEALHLSPEIDGSRDPFNATLSMDPYLLPNMDHSPLLGPFGAFQESTGKDINANLNTEPLNWNPVQFTPTTYDGQVQGDWINFDLFDSGQSANMNATSTNVTESLISDQNNVDTTPRDTIAPSMGLDTDPGSITFDEILLLFGEAC